MSKTKDVPVSKDVPWAKPTGTELPVPPTPPEATPPEATPPEATPPEATPPEATPPEATPPEATEAPAGVVMVTVTVPKGFKLRIDSHSIVEYKAGVQEMPLEHAEHWYAKANKVEQYRK